MRTKALLVAAAIGAAGIATVMADPVYSVNVVGFVNLNLVKNYNLIVNPLQATNNAISTILPTVPDGSTVYQWDAANQHFAGPNTFNADFGGWDIPNSVIQPGEAFFVLAAQAFTATFVGEVRQAISAPLSTPLVPGYNFVGSQVPLAGSLTDTLTYAANDGESLYRWNTALQHYDITSYNFDFGGWDGGDPNLALAEGVVLLRTAAGAWTSSFTVQ
jgi:hypothetical protein